MKKLRALLALTALLGLALFAPACKKDEPKPAPVVAPVKEKAPKAADKAAEAKAAADKAAAEKKAAEAKLAAKPKAADASKEKLAAAYADIYCAQITGKPEDVLAAYKRHGFENLDDWTRAWRSSSKDVEWVKQVMTDAKKACP